MRQKACFLDRDGVINVEMHYLHDPDKVILESGAAEAIRLLREAGYKIIVVTNQAGVDKGLYQEKDIHLVHAKIEQLLAAENAAVDGFYYCMHHPAFTGDCRCRKPRTGMFEDAARDHCLDLEKSAMVGDRLTDLEAGRNAKCRQVILVKTGYGLDTIREEDVSAFSIADNLLDAVRRYLL